MRRSPAPHHGSVVALIPVWRLDRLVAGLAILAAPALGCNMSPCATDALTAAPPTPVHWLFDNPARGSHAPATTASPPELAPVQRGEYHGLPPFSPARNACHPPRVTAAKPRVKGALDKAIISRIVQSRISQAQYCFQRELKAHPRLDGTVVMRFIIGATGRVQHAKVERSTLGNSSAETCLAQMVRQWLFPRCACGGIVLVEQPFAIHEGRCLDGDPGLPPIRSRISAHHLRVCPAAPPSR